MREIVHSHRRDARAVPWRNGRGVTHELARWPLESDFERLDFDWRISRAEVREPAPFSAFPGFDRILVVVEGDGLVLSHGELAPRTRLRRLEPYRFSGDWPTSADLTAGPIADFGVLLRAGACDASAEVVVLGRRRLRESLAPGHAFLHVLAGTATARVTREEQPFALDAGDSLWMRELGRGEELDLTGASDACTAVLVRLVDVRPVRG